jgi:hypothetical protein
MTRRAAITADPAGFTPRNVFPVRQPLRSVARHPGRTSRIPGIGGRGYVTCTRMRPGSLQEVTFQSADAEMTLARRTATRKKQVTA